MLKKYKIKKSRKEDMILSENSQKDILKITKQLLKDASKFIKKLKEQGL